MNHALGTQPMHGLVVTGLGGESKQIGYREHACSHAPIIPGTWKLNHKINLGLDSCTDPFSGALLAAVLLGQCMSTATRIPLDAHP